MQYSTIRLGATKVASYSFLTPILVLAIDFLLGRGTMITSLIPGILMVTMAMLIIQNDRANLWNSLFSGRQSLIQDSLLNQSAVD